ncbi:MAG: 23S rRNA (uracil(1939)-C(5))-methyltransferase RlmD [Oscillospiraceae bacterium]|nr:23S rRNA (uracil(1939)-C(5))-methyltransferase RlmD [Oscillospiraceae bacterium]
MPYDPELRGNGCPVFKKCGGCQLQNLTYPEQLRYKQGRCIALLGRFAHVERIVGMDEPYHYRCKVQAGFARTRAGLVSGVFQSGSGRVVPVENCMIEDEVCSEAVAHVRDTMKELGIRPWDGRTGSVRHVLVRRGLYTGELMAVIVTQTRQLPSKNAFVRRLLERMPAITTVVQNVCADPLPLTLGRVNETLYGEGFIADELLGKTFRISPNSFYQVNPAMTGKLYQTALDFLDLRGSETLLDAYCGTGTIGVAASDAAGRLIGVELNADAVRDAKRNARVNGAENAEFFRGDAAAFMETMAVSGEKLDALVMDPPRAGSSARFIRAAVKAGPERIVYVSCEPETLARDLALFTKSGYRVRRIRPIDMFPHTNHCEVVASLTRDAASR